MNTKLPLLALILGLSGALGAQNAATKTVPLAKTAKPYSWLMRPTNEFFAETGLSPGDSVSANTYLVGTGSETVLVNTGRIDALNQNVVWYVAFRNFKIKDLKTVVDSLRSNYNLNTDDEGSTNYWLSDALVRLETSVDDKGKLGTLELDAFPVYQFMPPVSDVVAKLDSTWQQLITNVQYKTRSVERDSAKISVTLKNVTPLVTYKVLYPLEEGDRPYTVIELNEGGGYGAVKWACKNYYDRFYDAFDEGSIWVSDTDQPTVKVGVLFNSGTLLNLQMDQKDFLEFAGDGE
jgi:hypothetical protein